MISSKLKYYFLQQKIKKLQKSEQLLYYYCQKQEDCICRNPNRRKVQGEIRLKTNDSKNVSCQKP